jgi:hypothetical protein
MRNNGDRAAGRHQYSTLERGAPVREAACGQDQAGAIDVLDLSRR